MTQQSRGRGRPTGVSNRQFYSALLHTEPITVPLIEREGRFVGVKQDATGIRAVFEDTHRDRFTIPLDALFSRASEAMHKQDGDPQTWIRLQRLLPPEDIQWIHAIVDAIHLYEECDSAQGERLSLALEKLRNDGYKIEKSAFYEKLRRYRREGPQGLLRRNHPALTHLKNDHLLGPLVRTATVVAEDQQAKPRITLGQFIELVRRKTTEQADEHKVASLLANTDDVTLRSVMRSVYNAAHLNLELDKRRSRLGLNQGRHQYTSARSPFATIQIDRTQLNVRLVDRRGHAMDTVDVLMAIDVCTRRILGFQICPRNATGAHVQAFMIHLTRGLVAPRLSRSPLPSLPSTLEVTTDVSELVQISELVVDRGSAESSQQTLEFLAALNLNIRIAPPGRGDAKGVIEGFYRILTDALRIMPGATGSNIMQTDHDSAVTTVLELEQFTSVLSQYIETIYHRQPSVKSDIPGLPDMSPNERLIWELSIGSGIPTVDASDISRIRAVLRRESMHLSVRGFMHHGLYYQDKDGYLADLMRSLDRSVIDTNGRRSVWVLYHDHYDDVVFAEIPGHDDLIPCFPHLRPQESFFDARTEFHLGSLFNLGEAVPLHFRLPDDSNLISHPFNNPVEGLFSIISQTHAPQLHWSDAKKRRRISEREQREYGSGTVQTDVEQNDLVDLSAIEEMLSEYGLFDDGDFSESGHEA